MWYPFTPQYLYKKSSPTLQIESKTRYSTAPEKDISELLQVTLNNMYFSFRHQVLRQREGLPMGSRISGILAILFMTILKPSPSPPTLWQTLKRDMLTTAISKWLMNKQLTTSITWLTMCTPIWNLKLKNQKQHQVVCHSHYSISKSSYPRVATALLNPIKSQPRNHYLSTSNQLCPPNPS